MNFLVAVAMRPLWQVGHPRSFSRRAQTSATSPFNSGGSRPGSLPINAFTWGATRTSRWSTLPSAPAWRGSVSRRCLKGLFFGTGDQAFDFRTLQDHIAPHTTSDLLFKGALRDRAKSVYVGVVRVEPQARGSSSNQANRNLLLSEKAKATSEPILEILNNDILRCSHGATVGPVDPEHLFYLESRGIPHPVAERMLVQGFLGEVLDRIPVAQVREAVDQELAARIE